MPFVHRTVVRLRDTDCAGVIFSPRLLEMALDAYEAYCDAVGLSLALRIEGPGPLLPIVHCDADYLQPMRLGGSWGTTGANWRARARSTWRWIASPAAR